MGPETIAFLQQAGFGTATLFVMYMILTKYLAKLHEDHKLITLVLLELANKVGVDIESEANLLKAKQNA